MRGLAILALVATIGIAACGGDDSEPAPASWNGPAFPYPDDGVLPVEEFRAYAEAVDEEWERDPAALARRFVRRPEADVTVRDGVAVVMRDNLEDDSVRAERYTLEVVRDGDVWTLVSARRDQRCHTGRGHEDFSPELCI
jgi:hypothetical protein